MAKLLVSHWGSPTSPAVRAVPPPSRDGAKALLLLPGKGGGLGGW